MQKSLTAKQKRILSTIKDLSSKLGKSPTLEEIREAEGYSAISSVQRHIGPLKKKGYLSSEPYQARSIEIFSSEKVNIPLVGNVAVGTPILAIENIEAYIPYTPTKAKFDSTGYFFLRAIGDSMNKASINGRNIENGDYVLVRKQNTANYGEIIVALLGEEATIKKYEKGQGHIILQPVSSNLDNKPIYVFDDFTIQGIVVDVIKREVYKE